MVVASATSVAAPSVDEVAAAARSAAMGAA